MSGIKNTSQSVSSKYGVNFDIIFGEKKDDAVNQTGTYVIDRKTGKTILIDKSIPASVRDKMEPLTATVGTINPVNVKAKEV